MKRRKMRSRQCKKCKVNYPTNRSLELIESNDLKEEIRQEWRCHVCGAIEIKNIKKGGVK